MPALGFAVHEDGRSRVLRHLGTCLLASCSQPFLRIVHNQLLTESIDEVLRASGDDKLVGVFRRETHGVANQIAPQATRRGDNHGIVRSHFHVPKGDDLVAGNARSEVVHLLLHLGQVVQGDELVEDTVVEHQQHRRIGGVVLYAEEALTGVVGLHVVHVRLGDELLILLSVGREGHTAVKKHFQVGPHLFEMLLARQLHDTCQHGEHPRRHATEVGDVLVQGLTGYAVTLHLEVTQQGCLL